MIVSRTEAENTKTVSDQAPQAEIRDQPQLATSRKALTWTSLKEEFTYEKMWKNRPWSNILQHFVKTLTIGLIPIIFDVYTDCASTENFFTGDYYQKTVSTITDPAVNSSDCINTGHYVQVRFGINWQNYLTVKI